MEDMSKEKIYWFVTEKSVSLKVEMRNKWLFLVRSGRTGHESCYNETAKVVPRLVVNESRLA